MNKCNNHIESQVAIVGGGATGLYAAYLCSIYGLSYVLIESSSFLGGKLAYEYQYGKDVIYDIPGIPVIRAKHLVEDLEKKALLNENNVFMNTVVNELSNDGVICTNKQGDAITVRCMSVILASGDGFYKPTIPKHVHNISNAYKNKKIKFMENWKSIDKEKYRNKRVIVVGSNIKSLNFVNSVSSVAENVLLVSPSNIFRGREQAIDEKKKDIEKHNNVEDIMYGYDLYSIHEDEVVFLEKGGNCSYRVDFDVIVAYYGFDLFNYRINITSNQSFRITSCGDRSSDSKTLMNCFSSAQEAVFNSFNIINGGGPSVIYSSNHPDKMDERT